MSLRNMYFTGSSEVISWLCTALFYHFMPWWIYPSIYVSNLVISAKFHLLPFGFHILYAQEKTEHLQKMSTIAMSNKPYILNIHFFQQERAMKDIKLKMAQPRPQGSLLSCAGNQDPWPGPTTFWFWMAL